MSEIKTNKISSLASNNDITIDPDGTGDTIIASGNVGIGTSSPSETLHVEESTTGNAVRVSKGGNYIVMGGSGSGTQYVKGYEGTIAFGNAFAGNTIFLTGDTERMRLDSSGNVGIGITPTSPLHVSSSTTGNITNVVATNTSYGNDVLQVRCARSGATTEYNNLTVFDNNTSLKMLIRANGNLLNSNNSYGSLSDQTLKENIVDSASQWDDIKAVQIRKYNFIDSDETQIGVVAQELEAAGMDGLVESVEMYSSNEENEPVRNGEFKKSVKYSVLHMKALKALQEAMNRIETLEARITALEAE